MVSNLPKRWGDDFMTAEMQRDGFGALKTNRIPSHPTSSSTGF
jgi:hypothetical protein